MAILLRNLFRCKIIVLARARRKFNQMDIYNGMSHRRLCSIVLCCTHVARWESTGTGRNDAGHCTNGFGMELFFQTRNPESYRRFRAAGIDPGSTLLNKLAI